jgi:Flp pilus assembly protein TadG
MRLPSPDSGGSITAEFAAVIPAVLLVLACSLAGIQLAAQQLRLQDAAATTARSLARGDTPPPIAATIATREEGNLLCAVLTQAATGILPLELTAESCALAGGR